MKKVKIYIKGGLGNQLFQLALMLTLREKLGFQVEYSLLEVLHDKQREPEVECLLQNFGFVQFDGGRVGSQYKMFFKIRKKILSSLFRDKYLVENKIPYDPDVYKKIKKVKSGSFYMEGYFQTKAFALINKNKIKNAIYNGIPLNSESKHYEKLIAAAKHSVSIHIRRGDYVTNTMASCFHGVCSQEYYKAGVEEIRNSESSRSLAFFIFSDDIDWCKENIEYLGLNHFDKINFIERQTSCDSYQDLILMSYCKSKIIANSSYSWWGGVLSNDIGITIAPKKWFANQNDYHLDIYQDNWIVL